MIVAVDARLLSIPLTGIGRYTLEMCSQLAKYDIELFLYSPNEIIHGDWQGPNIHIRQRKMKGRLGRMLWSQTILPHDVNKDKPDIFWGPTHRIPSGLSTEIIKLVTIHDLVWKFAPETMRAISRMMERLLMPQAIKIADWIISDSSSTTMGLIELYPQVKNRVTEIYLGVTSFGDYQDIKLTCFDLEQPFFLFVGTLEPRKNLLRLLKAYSMLTDLERELCKFVIAGGAGWGNLNLKNEIDALGLNSQVQLLGYVTDQQLAILYKNAKFLAMPSIYEGFGLPLVEANVFGTPVLTSNTSSLPEVAGEAALLVDPFSIDAIKQGLSKLICDQEFLASLEKKAYLNSTRFSWKKSAEKLIFCFEDCLNIR
jgi:glycosyltransferase involved in cell wall biosynthesis